MMWFGESWGAPICDGPHVDTPVGQACLWCAEKIEDGDQGVVMSAIKRSDLPGQFSSSLEPMHIECNMRSVIGSVGHLNKKCSCYGGYDEDPPGMTKRQAAAAAWSLFNKIHGQGEA